MWVFSLYVCLYICLEIARIFASFGSLGKHMDVSELCFTGKGYGCTDVCEIRLSKKMLGFAQASAHQEITRMCVSVGWKAHTQVHVS